MRRIGTYLLLALLVPLGMQAQSPALEKGTAALEAGRYAEALRLFRKAGEQGGDGMHWSWMSRAFRAMGAADSAQVYQARFVDIPTGNKETEWLLLGRLALYNEDSLTATRAFSHLYAQGADPTTARAYLDLLQNSPAVDPRLKAERLPFNSPQADFGGVPYGDGMVFASERNNSQAGVRYKSAVTGLPLSNLFYVSRRDSVQWRKSAAAFWPRLNTRFHEGPVWVAPDSSFLIFERSGLGVGDNAKRASVWRCDRQDNSWGEPRPVEIAGLEGQVSHPWVNAATGEMVFSADLPGGAGGMDLYAVPLDRLEASQVRSLGPLVNTPGDEVYPTITSGGDLIFASNGHPGFGGLDVFQYSSSTPSQAPTHFPKPINSPQNDHSFYLNDSTLRGWLTSNRPAGGRNEDIFGITLAPDTLPAFGPCEVLEPFDYCYTFFDEISGETLPYGMYYLWDLGDGTERRGHKVSHCYAEPGTYRVSLFVTDSLTGEPVFNQARYELDVAHPYPLFIESTDPTAPVPPAVLPRWEPRDQLETVSFQWDLGQGWFPGELGEAVALPNADTLTVRLGVRGTNGAGDDWSECVERGFGRSALLSLFQGNSNGPDSSNLEPDPRLDSPAPARYQIQLGTARMPLPTNSSLYSKVPGAVERQEGDYYRYFAPGELSLEAAFAALAEYRNLGFSHPSIVRLQENDPYFQRNWLPGTVAEEIVVTGQITDKRNVPVEGNIIWENLRTGEVVLESKIGADGSYEGQLPKEAFYGYYVDLEGYYSVSRHLDLTAYDGDVVIEQDLKLVSIDDMIRYQLPVRINNLFFDFDKSELQAESLPELYRLVRFVQDHPGLKFHITGHTDNLGSLEYNADLSRRRAGEVGRFLVLAGCDPNQLAIEGRGETDPVASNADASGRRENRRVEFTIERMDHPQPKNQR